MTLDNIARTSTALRDIAHVNGKIESNRKLHYTGIGKLIRRPSPSSLLGIAVKALPDETITRRTLSVTNRLGYRTNSEVRLIHAASKVQTPKSHTPMCNCVELGAHRHNALLFTLDE